MQPTEVLLLPKIKAFLDIARLPVRGVGLKHRQTHEVGGVGHHSPCKSRANEGAERAKEKARDVQALSNHDAVGAGIYSVPNSGTHDSASLQRADKVCR